jgi:hypothetical protein
MALQTLAEAAKLIQNDLVRGVAEDIIDVNPWHAVVPLDPFTGQSVTVNRENALGDVQMLQYDGTITAKAAATYAQVSFLPTIIIGDAELAGLQVATSASAGVDQTALEISSKSKSIGRRLMQGIVVDDGVDPNLNSLHSLVDASQYTGTSVGQALTFELLDELMDLLKAKDGVVDWMQAAPRTLRRYKVLLRALGGTPADWVLQVPFSNGQMRSVIAYEGVPIFKNEFITITETADGAATTGGLLSSVYGGVWDDGSRKVGVALIHPAGTPAGIAVQLVGTKEDEDADVWRVKQYVNFAQYNRRGTGRLPSINAS